MGRALLGSFLFVDGSSPQSNAVGYC
jgi:hypothetical protein